MADKRTDIARTEEKGLAGKEGTLSPYGMVERFAEDMHRVFDDFGFGRRWLAPRLGFGLPGAFGTEGWLPEVEMLQRNNELVFRADLPGVSKDDVKVDVTEDAITIHGERKREREEETGGVYRSERSYGSFTRTIVLPEGTMTDQAKATFKDGVLEVTMPTPPESVKRARRLEIAETAPKK